MSRDWKLYWSDIIAAAERVERYTAGMASSQFRANEMAYDAVMRCLIVIGEAAKQLPAEARALAPLIDWRKIAATRDIIAHVYFGINDAIIWDIVENKVPELLKTMRPVTLS